MAHTVMLCPKPIPQASLVPRPKHNTAFVGFTRVNNQGESNNIQGIAQICHSRRMEQNIHRRLLFTLFGSTTLEESIKSSIDSERLNLISDFCMNLKQDRLCADFQRQV
ncbi:hypothetical protein TNCV_3356081 [Trichonephila clavipes]|nr:hypothetical protein TNCV_3356081 [Trichonephila clavipes]